jgi:hypothetical protein
MALNNLFNKELKVINVGLELFYDDLTSLGCEAIQTNWSIPTTSDARIKNILDKFEILDELGDK